MKLIYRRKHIVRWPSHPARGAWIEIKGRMRQACPAARSHPARGAWIEIRLGKAAECKKNVAPRKGCVD